MYFSATLLKDISAKRKANKIWTRATDSISYDDNRYNKSAF